MWLNFFKGCAEQQEEFYNCADIAIIENTMRLNDDGQLMSNTTNDTLKSHSYYTRSVEQIKINYALIFLFFLILKSNLFWVNNIIFVFTQTSF